MTKAFHKIIYIIIRLLTLNTGFLVCKERPNVNNFTKSFAHILNYEFYRLYYIVK